MGSFKTVGHISLQNITTGRTRFQYEISKQEERFQDEISVGNFKTVGHISVRNITTAGQISERHVKTVGHIAVKSI